MALVLAGVLAGSVACGAPAAGNDKTITITGLVEQTGSIAYAGQAAEEGMQVATDYVNDSGMLGDRKLKLDLKDAASSPATSGAVTSQVAKSDSIAMLGPLLSNDSLAAAPIAQRGKLPMVAVQTNTTGVVETGDYIYRATAPLSSFNRLTTEELKKEGVKTLGMVYPSDIVSTSTLGKDIIPGWAKDLGISVTDLESSPSSSTDFSAAISKLTAANPDAIGMLVLDTQLPSLIQGLRRSGYQGILFTHFIQLSTLDKIGTPANGMLWAADYSPAMTGDMSVTFTNAFRKKFNKEPEGYNANGFDAVLFVANALKDPSVDTRDELRAKLAQVANTGFDGATGQITFDQKLRRDARVAGVLVQWHDGRQTIIAEGKPGLDQQ
jgi:branched-chain amino acid transport system substrate-binding protein